MARDDRSLERSPASSTIDPLYLDLRWARSASQLTLKHPPFYAAIAELAATIRGCPKDDIVGEDLASHQRTIRLASSASQR